jgi:uncharacterized protein YlzI (FlbEa/FlbD family)
VNEESKEYFNRWCDEVDKTYIYRRAMVHNKRLLEDALIAIRNGDDHIALEFIDRVIDRINDSMKKTDRAQKKEG